MKRLIIALALIFVIGLETQAQTDDSTRYIWYKFQYGSRMPRGMWDSVMHIPYLDTAQLYKAPGVKARAGALTVRPQDKLLYVWDGDKWNLITGSSGVTEVRSGWGITGGPITDDGELSVDSVVVSGYYLRRSDSTVYVTLTRLKDTASLIRSLIKIDSVNNGLSRTGTIGQLGGTLLKNTTIDQAGFNMTWSGNGYHGIGVAANSAYKLRVRGGAIRGNGLFLDSFVTVGGYESALTTYGRPYTVGNGIYGTGLVDYTFVTGLAGWKAYIGVMSWSYMTSTGAPSTALGTKFKSYLASFSGGQVFDGNNQTLDWGLGYFSSINNQNGTMTNAADYYASEINSTNSTTNSDSVGNHYAFYSENFGYSTGGTKNYGWYINGVQPNYAGGKLWIGSKIDTTEMLNVTGNGKFTGKIGIGVNPIYDLHLENTTARINSTNTSALGSTTGGQFNGFNKLLPTAADQQLAFHGGGTMNNSTTETVTGGWGIFSSAAFTFGSSHQTNMRAYVTTTTGLAEVVRITSNQRVGIRIPVPTAALHLPAGTTSAQNAPMKYSKGSLMTTAEDGAWEYDLSGINFYQTNVTGVRGVSEKTRVIVSSAGTLSPDANYSDYVFSGTTTTWTLPTITGNTNVKIYIKNRGSGNITLNSNAGGNDIYSSSAVNTISITPGSSVIIVNDGTYWLTID